MDLYEQERRVGEYYAAIGEVVRSAWRIQDMRQLLRTYAEQVGQRFGFDTVAVIRKRGSRLHLSSYYRQAELHLADESVNVSGENSNAEDVIMEAVIRQQAAQRRARLVSFPALHADGPPLYFAAIPLRTRDALIGALVLGREAAFDHCELDILHDLAEHVSLAIDNIHLHEQNEQLLLAEERRRLARDLHDGVSQKLFSLTLMAQGMRVRMKDKREGLEAGLQEIDELAQEALSEMKVLLWDWHAHDDKDRGVAELLERYARKLGLTLLIHQGRHLRLPSGMEETLWRIGQEALNNVKKHAFVSQAEAQLTSCGGFVQMRIADQGRGFQPGQQSPGSLGLISMRERVRSWDGRLAISSVLGKGTTVEVTIPLASEAGESG